MVRINYRIDHHVTKDGLQKYFLVKDLKVGGKNAKVRKYIGSGTLPPPEEIERLSQKLALDIETEAIEKAARLSSARYKPKYFDEEKAELIERVRYTYKALTEILTVEELRKYEEDFEINYVQGTTSIEGNTLSLGQTRDLLLEGILPEGKSLREINEVQNYKKVRDYRSKYRGRLTLRFIKSLHGIIMSNIDDSAGVFRRSDLVGISGCDFRLTPAFEIEDELRRIIDDYYEHLKNDGHPFEEAARFHYQFEMIHPFTDGNGRVGRELFNYLLMRSRPPYPKLLFLGKDRPQYIKALKLGNEERYAEMVSIFADMIIGQRLKVLDENFRRMMEAERRGQMRLSEFIRK